MVVVQDSSGRNWNFRTNTYDDVGVLGLDNVCMSLDLSALKDCPDGFTVRGLVTTRSLDIPELIALLHDRFEEYNTLDADAQRRVRHTCYKRMGDFAKKIVKAITTV